MEFVFLLLVIWGLVKSPLKTLLTLFVTLGMAVSALYVGLHMEQRNSHRKGHECSQKLVDLRVSDIPKVGHCLRGK